MVTINIILYFYIYIYDTLYLDRKDGVRFMDFKTKEIYLHYIMCLNGGFLGGYSLLCRNGDFGSAQTTNMFQILFTLLGKNLEEFSIRLFGLILYCSGILICTFLLNQKLFNMQRYVILVNMLGVILLSVLPTEIDPLIGILPIFFMTSTQWSIFHGTENYNCSTIFSTNNVRQFVSSLGDYLINKKDDQKDKALFYALTLFWYYFGAVISFVSCNRLEVHASLVCIPFMLFAWILTFENNPFIGLIKIKKYINGGLL